jgi:hypothetical protein
VVSPSRLYSDYHANEVAADQAYKGKWIMTTGRVKSIEKDFLDNIIVYIYVPVDVYGLDTVNAYVNAEQQSAAAALQIGQTISVECVGGTMVIGAPVLEQCTILH